MIPPMVSFVTWNRAGLNARNIKALLDTSDDFELYIIDNGSKDDTWEFIQELKDDRIKCKTRFDVNYGLVYAMNYTLKDRKKEQYYISIDSDVCIKTNNFIKEYMKVMDTFKDVGLLGAVRDTYYQEKNISYMTMTKGNSIYYQYHVIVGCCICIRPEVFDYIGYWNEETCGADIDLSLRITNFTPFKIGFIPSIQIDQLQRIKCTECLLYSQCSMDKNMKTCFQLYNSKYRHREFANIIKKKEDKYLKELYLGNRTIYCASIHDPISIENHIYDRESAQENFDFFINYCN